MRFCGGQEFFPEHELEWSAPKNVASFIGIFVEFATMRYVSLERIGVVRRIPGFSIIAGKMEDDARKPASYFEGR